MLDIGVIAKEFPGWSLTELRRMPVPTRRYWHRFITSGKDGTFVQFPEREGW